MGEGWRLACVYLYGRQAEEDRWVRLARNKGSALR
jgi:hypothetical protein